MKMNHHQSHLHLLRQYSDSGGQPWRRLWRLPRFWLADHPKVAGFRWDHDAWGSSWSFLVLSVSAYLLSVAILRAIMRRFFKGRTVPLGPIPAVYNVVLLAGSAVMFAGCFAAMAVEVQELRWLYKRRRWPSSPMELLVCLPLGTRPAGRVFFWSYAFYVSKYYEFLGTFILLMQNQSQNVHPLGHAFRNAMVILMCFLWLSFSQSLQILALLTSTGFYVLMHAYFFLWKARLAPPWKNIAYHCHIAQYSLMAIGSVALLALHFGRYGCSGMQSWFFGSLLDLISLPIVFVVSRSDSDVHRSSSFNSSARSESFPRSESFHESSGDSLKTKSDSFHRSKSESEVDNTLIRSKPRLKTD